MPLGVALVFLVAVLAFAAGRQSAPAVSAVSPASERAAALLGIPQARLYSARAEADPRLIQAAEPLDPRELIPMQQPGQGDGQAPGQEGEAEQCVLVDGQLFQLPAPGEGQGGEGGTPELIPLVPVPQGPGQQPAPPQQQVPSGPPAGSLRM